MTAPRIIDARIGDTVTAVCGPGEFAEPRYARWVGTVYGIVRDRWGVHCRVKVRRDDGGVHFDTVHSFTTRGIGCYLYRDGQPVQGGGR